MSIAMGVGLARSQAPRVWWPANASFAADFITGRYMRQGVEVPVATALSFSRASTAMAQTRDGQWRLFAPGVPAMTDQGIQLEEALQYEPQNSLLLGAVPGTLGAGGLLPTGWHVITGGSLTTRVDSIGQQGDVPYIRLHVQGISSGDYQLGFDNNTVIATPGQTWSASLAMRLVSNAGVLPTPYVRCVEQNAASYLAASEDQLPWTPAFTRRTVTRPFTDPTTTRAKSRARLTSGIGDNMDLVFDLALPSIAPTGSLHAPALTNDSAPWLRATDGLLIHLPANEHHIGYYFDDVQVYEQTSTGPVDLPPSAIPSGRITSIVAAAT